LDQAGNVGCCPIGQTCSLFSILGPTSVEWESGRIFQEV